MDRIANTLLGFGTIVLVWISKPRFFISLGQATEALAPVRSWFDGQPARGQLSMALPLSVISSVDDRNGNRHAARFATIRSTQHALHL